MAENQNTNELLLIDPSKQVFCKKYEMLLFFVEESSR